MSEMARLAAVARTHPIVAGAAVIAVLAVALVAWYLGSPLFIRTYTNEALPAVSAEPTRTAASTTAASLAPASPAARDPRVLKMGDLQFVDAVHNGKGPVRVVEVGGQRLVRFEDVEITNAPDVHVYLSKESGGKWSEATSLYLGPLKATNGSFNYELTQATDLGAYQSVVVWCRAFRVLITWADLA